MQAITPALAAILKAHFQAGADGFHAQLYVSGLPYPLVRASFDKSLTTDADRCEVEIDNSTASLKVGDLSPDARAEVFAWYGDIANSIKVFDGLIDYVQEHRHPNVVTISARDWMKKLIVQKISLIGPQAATDPLAIRTTDNFVYLNMLVEDIVTDLLLKAGDPFPGGETVEATGITVDEFLGNDDEPFASAISRLADLPGFHSFADEFGAYFFKFLRAYDDGINYDYTYASSEDVYLLAHESSDDQTYTRVQVSGPMTTTATVPAWLQTWVTTNITHPVGSWYVASDAANIRVLDSHTKRIYVMRQSDQVLLSSWYIGATVAYPLGLSGDPSDATIYWVLDAPWAFGGPNTGNRIHKFAVSDNHLIASYALPTGRWTDMKVSAAYVWATDYDTDKFWSFDKGSLAPVAGYALAGKLNPTGIAVDGTELLVFYTDGNSYKVDESAPTVILSTILSAADMWGGEWDTTTHSDLYVVGSGQVWKYSTSTTSSTSVQVSAESVDATLEAYLLALTGYQEIRRLVVQLPAILSLFQAGITADAILASVDKFSDTLDVGIIGHPGLQKGDIVKVVDPVLDLNAAVNRAWQVITYRSDLAGDQGTYLGTLSLKRLKSE